MFIFHIQQHKSQTLIPPPKGSSLALNAHHPSPSHLPLCWSWLGLLSSPQGWLRTLVQGVWRVPVERGRGADWRDMAGRREESVGGFDEHPEGSQLKK